MPLSISHHQYLSAISIIECSLSIPSHLLKLMWIKEIKRATCTHYTAPSDLAHGFLLSHSSLMQLPNNHPSLFTILYWTCMATYHLLPQLNSMSPFPTTALRTKPMPSFQDTRLTCIKCACDSRTCSCHGTIENRFFTCCCSHRFELVNSVTNSNPIPMF